MTLAKLLLILLGLVDATALLSLFTTGEIQLVLGFIALTAICVFSRIQKELSQTPLIAAYLVIFLCALFFIGVRKIHPVDVGAHAILFAHALAFLGKPGIRARGFRLGLCFFEVVLAGALNPAAETAALMFVFAVIASAALFCLYLEQSFLEHLPTLLDRPVPKTVWRFLSVSSAVMLVSSMILFPMLPRLKTGLVDLFPQIQVGYAEDVDLNSTGKWTRTENRSVMEVFLPAGAAVESLFPQRLMKGRVLELFDGTRWKASKTSGSTFETINAIDEDVTARAVRVVRHALGSPVIPLAYGTGSIYVAPQMPRASFLRRGTGDWAWLGSDHQSVIYYFEPALRFAPEREGGSPAQLTLETKGMFAEEGSPWPNFARDLFSGAKSTSEKISRVRSLFAKREFTSSLDDIVSTDAAGPSAAYERLSQFLFETKRGHCGYFAASAAILFRLGGVPSRVVGGFLLPSRHSQGVVFVRQSNAHAWVEVYDGELGWVPLDLTPPVRSSGVLALFDKISEAWFDLQNFANAVWYKYVLTYDERSLNGMGSQAVETFRTLSGTSFFQGFGAVAMLLSVFAVSVVCALAVMFKRSRKNRLNYAAPSDLRRRRRRLRRLLKSKSAPAELLQEITALDERLRFGPPQSAGSRASALRRYDVFLATLEKI